LACQLTFETDSNIDPLTRPIGAQEEGRTQEEECAQEEGRELTLLCNLYLSGCTIFHLMLTPTTLGSQEEGRDQEEDRAEEEGRHQEDRRQEVNSSALLDYLRPHFCAVSSNEPQTRIF